MNRELHPQLESHHRYTVQLEVCGFRGLSPRLLSCRTYRAYVKSISETRRATPRDI